MLARRFATVLSKALPHLRTSTRSRRLQFVAGAAAQALQGAAGTGQR